MKDRIRQIMEDQHLNQQNFAQLIGKSTATLSSIFNDRTKPSLDIVDAIKKKLPQVNLEWLLYGTPPMYINKVEGAQAGASARGENGADEDSLDMYGDAVGVAGRRFGIRHGRKPWGHRWRWRRGGAYPGFRGQRGLRLPYFSIAL